ncbi:MAG: hypothetical protein ACWGQW_07175, partial [bacterium]
MAMIDIPMKLVTIPVTVCLFNLSPRKYLDRYFMGHYSPLGNHFFTYAIMDDVVKWLSPPPPTYRDGEY